MKLVAKTFLGLEGVLAQELKGIGASNIVKERRAVTFEGDLSVMYKANIWLRTASRILKPINTFEATDADEVYRAIKKIEWDKYLQPNQTFSVNATVYSDNFRNSRFVVYRAKDAIVDFFNEKYNARPSVRLTNPKITINVHISHHQCTISIDSSGDSLHKRGYRSEQTKAPINEALAAGMILMTGWQGKCNLIDFMCGSGTILIEAALIALNIPPGIYRKHFAFENWDDFDRNLFDKLLNDDDQELEFGHKIYGYDLSPRAVEIARQNVKSAGLSRYIEVELGAIAKFTPPQGKNIIVSNPPYGERLNEKDLLGLYQTIGSILKHKCMGIDAWLISSNIDLLKSVGLKPSKKIELLNGDLNCEYWKFEVFSGKRNDFLASNNTRKSVRKRRYS